ncbi:MAG: hypothetical protein RIS94_2935 [Pseudomonadota bacterium]
MLGAPLLPSSESDSSDSSSFSLPLLWRVSCANDVRSPGEWLAAFAVLRVGPALLHAGTRPWVVGLGALLTALIGLGAGWFHWFGTGFVALALAWLLLVAGGLLARIERDSLLSRKEGLPAARVGMLGLDACMLTLAAWRSEIPVVPGVPAGLAWFAPLALLLLLHLLPEVLPPRRWTWWLRDRFVTGLTFAAASVALPFDATVRLAVLGLLGTALIMVRIGRGISNPELTTEG